MKLFLQIAGVAVGSPVTLGPGGTFTTTFPAPPNGGTYVVRTDYTPTGATAAVASYATNLVVNGGTGGTTPLTLTLGFGNGANGQPPTSLTLSLGHAQPCDVPSIYICTELSRLPRTILKPNPPETSRSCVGVILQGLLLHGHFSSSNTRAVALQQAINILSYMCRKRGSCSVRVLAEGLLCAWHHTRMLARHCAEQTLCDNIMRLLLTCHVGFRFPNCLGNLTLTVSGAGAPPPTGNVTLIVSGGHKNATLGSVRPSRASMSACARGSCILPFRACG